MKPTSVERQFTVALEALVEQIKGDRSVLAAILCGSLSHDTVWAKSDIDLVLVTIDDQKVPRVGRGPLRRRRQRPRVPHAARQVPQHGRRLDPQLVHARAAREGAPALHPRSRRLPICASGCARSAIATPRCSCCARRRARSRRSTRPTSGFSRAATWTTPRCGFSTPRRGWRGVEVIGARLVADREVIPQAMKLNPAFFKIVYADLLNTKKTQKNVQAALDAIDGYVAARAPALFALVIELPARGRRSAVGERDRGALHPELRRRRGDDRLRVSGRPGPHRQGLDPRPPHEEEQRRGPGAGVFLHG